MFTNTKELRPGNLIIYLPDPDDDYLIVDLLIKSKNVHDQYTAVSYLIQESCNKELSIEHVNISVYNEAKDDSESYVWIL